MTIANAINELERQAAAKQTLADKQAVWTNFLSRLRGGKPANTIDNFTFLVSILEKEGKLVTADNLHAALLSSLDYLPSGYDRTAEVAAQQSAAQKAQAEQTAKLNAWFENAQATYGLVDDSWNRQKLVDYLILHFHGVPSEIALTAFVRDHIDNPELHRLAQPSSRAMTPDEMWAKQTVLRNPAHELEERRREAAEKRKKFDAAMSDSKARATFESEIRSIRGYREMGRLGVDWSQTWAIQRDRLSQLKTKYPAYASELDVYIAKVGR